LASVERIKELLPHLHGHAAQRRCELVRRAQPPAMMIAVDAAWGIAVAFWLVAGSTADAAVKGKGAALCWSACRHFGRAVLSWFRSD